MTIHKARKKPVEIEFIQFKNLVSAGEIERWTNLQAVYDDSNGKDLMFIDTLEGVMTATINDYIVKGINGEFYAVKPNVFEKTYDILPDVIKDDYICHKE
ncbi:hypothetical protein [Staphylococcus delphini]|uniref:hypothetical protein n=1 Tax=Staphylococcus delphini TaxID=53344 RepID=UPI0021D2CA92|nr:hypothetical protein MUA39_09295 [Staphylococcus delphini]UXS45653.1 hypothetical protein MUA39_10385 [Staphylococcus delphini]UXV46243.1 hypothetical protein MUA63_09265 [Staphylococcus delphini]UXV46349.1 hypothetical protein MUA63_13485 [Staphylococcus delphini]